MPVVLPTRTAGGEEVDEVFACYYGVLRGVVFVRISYEFGLVFAAGS